MSDRNPASSSGASRGRIGTIGPLPGSASARCARGGESPRDRCSGGGADAAERQVARRPNLHPRRVGRKHRAADVIGADVVDHPRLNHRNRSAVKPHIFPDQRARGLIIFRNPVAV